MTVGKGSRKKKSFKDKFDTSECQVVFRKPRVDVNRNPSFDHNRELFFNHNRSLDARLEGVVFRDHFAIGFRNTGIGNIEEVASDDDWPEIEPAKSPKSLVIERDVDWDQTWGRDQSYRNKWGSEINTDREKSIHPAPRIKPQLTYFNTKGSNRSKSKSAPPKAKKSSPKKPFIDYQAVRSRPQNNHPAQRMTLLETGREPMQMQPSRQAVTPSYQAVSSSTSSISPKDKKRGYAFNEYALSLMESGQYDRAMKYFQKARDLDPYEDTYKTNMKRCQQWIDYRTRGH